MARLALCEHCRQQAADLRAVMSAVADVEVLTSLFWDHLSARVSEGVADVAAAAPPGLRHGDVEAGHADRLAAVIVAAIVAGRASGAAIARAADRARPARWRPSRRSADASLSLIADLAGDLDWDAAVDAG